MVKWIEPQLSDWELQNSNNSPNVKYFDEGLPWICSVHSGIFKDGASTLN
jgi:hypothetical protein